MKKTSHGEVVNVNISVYSGAKELMENASTDDIMQQVTKNLHLFLQLSIMKIWLTIDLMQRKDFIFRTFVENYDSNGEFLGYVPQSIDTGKSESITTSNGEKIETLNRFRNALQSDPNGGTVVQSIENENIGKRIFSPMEQALTHINISSGLSVDLQISEQAYAFEESLRQMLGEELDKDLQKILTPFLHKRK